MLLDDIVGTKKFNLHNKITKKVKIDEAHFNYLHNDIYYTTSSNTFITIIQNKFKNIPVRAYYDFNNKMYVFANAQHIIHQQLIYYMTLNTNVYKDEEKKWDRDFYTDGYGWQEDYLIDSYLEPNAALFQVIWDTDIDSHTWNDKYNEGYWAQYKNLNIICRSKELQKCEKVPLFYNLIFNSQKYDKLSNRKLNEYNFNKINWKNDMNAIGNVPATIGHTLFAKMMAHTFLRLTPKFSYGDDAWFDKQIKDNNAFGIPFLKVEFDFDNKIMKVVGHEGRHRVAAVSRLKDGEITSIPVAILYNHDRYPNIPTPEELRTWKFEAENSDTQYDMNWITFYNKLPLTEDVEYIEDTEILINPTPEEAQLDMTFDMMETQLNESVGKQYLYHGTKLDVLFQILKDNMLEGSESTSGGGYCPYGVSTSRSLNFSYNFAENSMHLNGDTFEENQKIAVIVLDRDKLKQNHKIITFHDNEAFSNFLNNKGDENGYYPELLEKEEVVMGDIRNVKNYIVGIYVSPDCKELNTPEKLFMYYYKYWTAFDDMTKEELDMFIGDNKDIINTIMNAKVYIPNRSEYNLRNNINEELIHSEKDEDGYLTNEIFKNPSKKEIKKYNLSQTRVVIDGEGNFYFCLAGALIHDNMIDKIGKGDNYSLFYDYYKNTFYERDEYRNEEEHKEMNKKLREWLLSYPYIKNNFGTDFNAYVFSYEYGEEPFDIKIEKLDEDVNLKYANRIAGFYFVKDKKWELLPRTEENVWETDPEKAIEYSHNSDSDWLEEVNAIRFSLEEKDNEPNTIRCIIESPKQKWVIPFIKLLEKKYPEEMSYITDYFVEYIKPDGTGATKYVKGNVFSF